MRIKDLVKLEVRKLQKLPVVGRDGVERLWWQFKHKINKKKKWELLWKLLSGSSMKWCNIITKVLWKAMNLYKNK